MNDTLTLIIQSAAASGPVAGLLLVAVWWQTRSNRELINQTNTHINERLKMCEAHIEECNQERADLRNRIFAILENTAKRP